MPTRTARASLVFLALGLTACLAGVLSAQAILPLAPPPDPDAARLIALSDHALQLARQPADDVVLRQVDTDLTTTTFHFTDPAAQNVTQVVVPFPEAAPDQWRVERHQSSPLLRHAQPSLPIQGLQIGPDRVALALRDHWPRCTVRGITLYQDNDTLKWTAFCTTAEGVVTGSMDPYTGVFTPSNAPPVRIPPTAPPG